MDNNKVIELLTEIATSQIAIAKVLDENNNTNAQNTKIFEKLNENISKQNNSITKLATKVELLETKHNELKDKEMFTLIETVKDLIKTIDSNTQSVKTDIETYNKQYTDDVKKQKEEYNEVITKFGKVIKEQQKSFEYCTETIKDVVQTTKAYNKQSNDQLKELNNNTQTLSARVNSIDTGIRTAIRKGPLADTKTMKYAEEELEKLETSKESKEPNELNHIEKLTASLSKLNQKVIND